MTIVLPGYRRHAWLLVFTLAWLWAGEKPGSQTGEWNSSLRAPPSQKNRPFCADIVSVNEFPHLCPV